MLLYSKRSMENWIFNAFLCFPFKQLMEEKPASHTVDVEGNGSSVLIAMPLSYRYSAFILIQKLARKFDSKKFCKPSSADSSNNLIDSKNMLNSLQSSDVLKSEQW